MEFSLLQGSWIWLSKMMDESFVMLPSLLLTAVLFWRRLKFSRAGTFFFAVLMFALVWRWAYCCALPVSSRYVLLPMLLANVLAVGGVFAVAGFFPRHRKLFVGLLLAVTVIVSVAKALNPTNRKDFIFETAGKLEHQKGILIDCSGENHQLATLLPQWKIIPSERRYGGNAFWEQLETHLQERQSETDQLYALLRIPVNRENDAFQNDFMRRWSFFPFDAKSELPPTRKYRYALYRFDAKRTGWRNYPTITPQDGNPFRLQAPTEIGFNPAGEAELGFDPEKLARNGLRLEIQAPRGNIFNREWRYRPKPGEPQTFSISLRLLNFNRWPVGAAQVKLKPGGQTADIQVDFNPTTATSEIGAETWAVPLPAKIRLDRETKYTLPLRLLLSTPDEPGWSFRVESPIAEAVDGMLVLEPVKTGKYPLRIEAARTGARNLQWQTWLEVLPPGPGQLRSVIFYGDRNFTNPDFLQSLEQQCKFRFTACSPGKLNAGKDRMFFADLLPDGEFRMAAQADYLILAMGTEEIVYGGKSLPVEVSEIGATFGKIAEAVHAQSPATRIILVLPPAPKLDQHSHAGLSGAWRFYSFWWSKYQTWAIECRELIVEAAAHPNTEVILAELYTGGAEFNRKNYEKVAGMFNLYTGNVK